MKHEKTTGGMLEDEYLSILQKYVRGAQNRQAGDDIYQTADEVAEVVMKAAIRAVFWPTQMNGSGSFERSECESWGSLLTSEFMQHGPLPCLPRSRLRPKQVTH
ncbi:hypothetical protein [uncultured Ruegeria sp.]|uniref:hypothetical protein n=1 Tax=uncultured Ruegeria sp. TaxID=259304 RepID=UPI002617B4A6|nr:hypothetical protein [uncultured Ruegeria sp.]